MRQLAWKVGLEVRLLKCVLLTAGRTMAWAADALEVAFQAVAPGVYAHVGDMAGRTHDNEALNANLGLVVTAAGAVLVGSGATFKTGQKIAEAAQQVTKVPTMFWSWAAFACSSFIAKVGTARGTCGFIRLPRAWCSQAMWSMLTESWACTPSAAPNTG